VTAAAAGGCDRRAFGGSGSGDAQCDRVAEITRKLYHQTTAAMVLTTQ